MTSWSNSKYPIESVLPGAPVQSVMAEYVYYLVDPDTKEVRYVGKTMNPKTRMASHCKHPGKSIKSWVETLKAHGKRPVMVLVEKTTPDRIREAEARHIQERSSDGLLNVDRPTYFGKDAA